MSRKNLTKLKFISSHTAQKFLSMSFKVFFLLLSKPKSIIFLLIWEEEKFHSNPHINFRSLLNISTGNFMDFIEDKMLINFIYSTKFFAPAWYFLKAYESRFSSYMAHYLNLFKPLIDF